jgi:hypothetical protein
MLRKTRIGGGDQFKVRKTKAGIYLFNKKSPNRDNVILVRAFWFLEVASNHLLKNPE